MKKGKKVGESNIALKDEDPKKEDTKYKAETEEEKATKKANTITPWLTSHTSPWASKRKGCVMIPS